MIELTKMIKKEWNISEIESLTEPEARELAEDWTVFKGHYIYFIDFFGAFGFSYCVFKNGKHIYYANNYELHNSSLNGDRTALMKRYKENIANKLFEESDFAEPLTEYTEYDRKAYYLRNYYAMQTEHYSIFTGVTEEQKARMVYDDIGLCYVPDPEFVKRHRELWNALEQRQKEAKQSFEYLKSAFVYEMYNHEYPINWQGNYDVLSCFYHIKYADNDSFANYVEQIGMSEMEKKAYREAAREVQNGCEW